MRVLVRPPYEFLYRNVLFSGEHSFSNSWLEPYRILKDCGEKRGILLDTVDTYELAEADAILFMDLPSKREFNAIRSACPRLVLILQTLESPLGRPQNWCPRNHKLFSGVITYNDKLVEDGFYFHYRLPMGPPPIALKHNDFLSRRPLAIINSNRRVSWQDFWQRSQGIAGLPLFGPIFSGWHIRIRELLACNMGELYSLRRRIAMLADQHFPSEVDVWGAGWQGERIGWTSRLRSERRFKTARGTFRGPKESLIEGYRVVLAFENTLNDCGYVSEKIFDAMYGGAVPAYLGNSRISELVPSNCFIDARAFRSPMELLKYCVNIGESEWQSYRRNIEEYLAGDQFKQFLPGHFSTCILDALGSLCITNGRGL